MAWTNAPIKGVKVFRMSRIDAYFNKRMFPKKHVAEKPVQLMRWCLDQLKVKPAETLVFDPFVGCGASMVAAQDMGYQAVGVDINPNWIDETKSRLNARARISGEEK
jgi:DNA modification methylase